MVAHAIGDIITGDTVEPEVIITAAPSVGGLFDSLTGSIGISSRAKPVSPQVPSSSPLGAAGPGSVTADTPKMGSRPLDKDALRTFISSSMPFGWYLLLWYSSSQFFLVLVLQVKLEITYCLQIYSFNVCFIHRHTLGP
jgi:AP-5 complex subunit mu-1